MKNNSEGKFELLHNAKRCFVYLYGTAQNMDGKITINKRLLNGDDIDILEALETRDIVIENYSGTKSTIDLAGATLDTLALSVLNKILDELEA